MFNSYWFFTAYIILLLFVPYINKLIDYLSQKQYLICLGIMLLLWVIIPTFFSQTMYGDILPQFLMFYMIGAYLRKFPHNFMRNPKVAKLICLVSFILLFLSNIIIDLLGRYIIFFSNKNMFFYSRTSLLVVGCAVGLFGVFVNKNFYSKYVNKLASCTFGVYLIHENLFIRKLLWIDWLKNYEYCFSVFFLLHLIVSVVLVYLFSVAIDMIYKLYVEKYVQCIYYSVQKFLLLSIGRIFHKCINMSDTVSKSVSDKQ